MRNNLTDIHKDACQQVENMCLMWYVYGRVMGGDVVSTTQAIKEFYKLAAIKPSAKEIASKRVIFCRFKHNLLTRQ